MMRTRLEETDAYRQARGALLDAEVALMQQRERVAELRRALPLDTPVPDYTLRESVDGSVSDVRLSQLFSSPDRTLVLYQFMYGKNHPAPCPMCSMWADGLDATTPHITRRADLALVAAAAPETFERYGRERGWRHIRLLSAGESTLKLDFGSEDEEGNQSPVISVFRLVDGQVRLVYASNAQLTDEHWRGLDLLSPVWHVFDLTPEGRDDWYPSLSYGSAPEA